jgi:hypothetical protein
VPAHRVLGTLSASHYFDRQNHRSLVTYWSADSSWAVVKYDGRFGFDSVTLVELNGDNLTQTDLGAHLAKATPNFSNASFYARLSANRKLRVRVVTTSDPKQMNPQGGAYGLFQGTYDLTSHRWTVEDGRKLHFDQYSALSEAFDSLDSNITSFPDLQNKLSYLDGKLNSAYGALRVLLPPERFAKLKAEQIAWLQQRDAAATYEERARIVNDRVVHLLDLLW